VFGYNEGPFGAHGEYLSIREDASLATMPANVTTSRPLPVQRACTMPPRTSGRQRSERGQDVLVNGATGAIGSAAVALLKSLGANVTAVCSTDNLGLARELGADRVIDNRAEDFTKDELR